jgi:hypothetical protein
MVALASSSLPTPLARDAREIPLYRTDEFGPGATDTLGRALANFLLPTPTTQETHTGPSQGNRNTVPLNHLVTMLPTPTASDGLKMSSNPATSASRREKGRQASLTDIVQTEMLPPGDEHWLEQPTTLLPTPTVMDMGANYTPDEWEAWKAAKKAVHQNGNGHGASLTQEAISLLPTPKAGDGDRGRDLPRQREDEKSRELATAAGWIGASTPPPSPDGSASSDDPHQPQLFPA